MALRVDNVNDARDVFENALKSNKLTVIEFMVDGTQLAPPFRRDALSLPKRFLPKYAHLVRL